MSFLWYRGGLSLLFGIEMSFFGIEILHSVVQHLDRLLPKMNPCVPFWAKVTLIFMGKENPSRDVIEGREILSQIL